VDAPGSPRRFRAHQHVRFENLPIEESPRLISLWINKAFGSRDSERGHIDGVVFKDVRAVANPLRVELQGYDEAPAVEDVRFEDVVVNGTPLSAADVKANAFVRRVVYRPWASWEGGQARGRFGGEDGLVLCADAG
jgi:hypothetical protein